MEDFILKPKRFLLLGYLLLGILMISVSYFCFSTADMLYHYPPMLVKFFGIVGILFFGLCTIIIFIKLLTAKPTLLVNEKGIVCFGILIPWSFIKGFYIYNIVSSSFLIIEIENFDYLYEQLSLPNKILVKGNIPYIGKNFYIQSQGTGYKTTELKDILQKYIETYRIQPKLIN